MGNYNLEKLMNGLKYFKIELSSVQVQQFIIYYELITEWNGFMNLTTITDFDEVVLKHFIDSLSLVKVYDLYSAAASKDHNSLIDVGTGAGFPGIPLKIVFPGLQVTLLDSLRKRVKFLHEVIQNLELDNIEALHGRAEDYAGPGKLRDKYDICVSRAVANLSTLTELCIPFVKTGGSFISYKSEKSGEEIKAAEKAVNVLGGQLMTMETFNLPESDYHRSLVVIKKIKETPGKYPRKAGIPSREPISIS